MSAEEKADELYVGFWAITNNSIKAKKCVEIVVDEILYVIGEPTYFHEVRAFWLRVKDKIKTIETT